MEIDTKVLATVVGASAQGSGTKRLCTPFERSRIQKIARATGQDWGKYGMMAGGVGGSFISPGWGTAAGMVIGGVGGNMLGEEIGARDARQALGCVER